MTRHRRRDPEYRHVATWEPARTSIGADFGEALLTGLLIGLVLVLLDRVIFGEWAELPAVGLLLVLPVLAVWIRTRTRGRVGPPDLVATDESPKAVKERVILLRTGRRPVGPDPDDPTLFEQFITGAGLDSTLDKWEPILGRETYTQWRDMLIDEELAAWRSDRNPRLGWRLLYDPGEILERLA